MSPTLNLIAPEIADPDLLRDLLAPIEPIMMREVANFHANALLRHLLTLVDIGEASDPAWCADLRGSLVAMQEVLG